MDETMKAINNKAMNLNDELAKRTKILEEQVADQKKTTNNLFKFFYYYCSFFI